MPTDFANFYQQALQQPNYSVQVPPQPQYTARPPRAGWGSSPVGQAIKWGGLDLGIGASTGAFDALFGGGSKPPQIPSGGPEFYKGRALLNAYNWLLPYSAETTQRGASAFGDIFRREAAKSKAYELAQFSEFAPQYAQAILNADPRQAKMLELYNQALGGGLNQAQDYATRLRGQLDQPMTSAAARDITQASLGQSALQGFGQGPRDAALAYINTGLVGNQLQQQREQQYMQALGLLGQNTGALYQGISANKSVLGDPFLAFAGRPGQPQGSNPQSPDYSGFNNDLFSYSVNRDFMNQNLAAAQGASNKALIGQLIGGGLGLAGSIGTKFI